MGKRKGDVCDFCGGPCGRVCRGLGFKDSGASAVADDVPPAPVEPERPASPARPSVSADPPPFRPYADGKGYSANTVLYSHLCGWCGTEFSGSMDKRYCSSRCRVSAWRDRKRTPIGKRPLYGGVSLRFAVLERDGFRCRYCGRGAAENAVLHVDHVVPRSAGGLGEMSNLLTACQECNRGKGDAFIERRPDDPAKKGDA